MFFLSVSRDSQRHFGGLLVSVWLQQVVCHSQMNTIAIATQFCFCTPTASIEAVKGHQYTFKACISVHIQLNEVYMSLSFTNIFHIVFKST